MSYCFGIDIGGTTVKCGLFTTEGVLLEKWEIKTRTEENGKAILPDVAETILKKMEEKGIEKTEVTGVGVGVPGPVVKEREVQVAVNLHWGYTMLADDLEKLLDQIPVKGDAGIDVQHECHLVQHHSPVDTDQGDPHVDHIGRQNGGRRHLLEGLVQRLGAGLGERHCGVFAVIGGLYFNPDAAG